jgi:hypothetical protein
MRFFERIRNRITHSIHWFIIAFHIEITTRIGGSIPHVQVNMCVFWEAWALAAAKDESDEEYLCLVFGDLGSRERPSPTCGGAPPFDS